MGLYYLKYSFGITSTDTEWPPLWSGRRKTFIPEGVKSSPSKASVVEYRGKMIALSKTLTQ